MMLGDLIKKYDQPIDLNERAKIKKEKKKIEGRNRPKDGNKENEKTANQRSILKETLFLVTLILVREMV